MRLYSDVWLRDAPEQPVLYNGLRQSITLQKGVGNGKNQGVISSG